LADVEDERVRHSARRCQPQFPLAGFGIRGIGSIYYLMFAVEAGLPDPLAQQLITVVLTTVALSTIVHGATVTPLMARYARFRG